MEVLPDAPSPLLRFPVHVDLVAVEGGSEIDWLVLWRLVHNDFNTKLYSRETVAQMIQAGQRVVDNPVYLSDLGET